MAVKLVFWYDHRLRAFDNRVLRKTCWPKTDEVTGEWIIPRN